MTDAAAPSRSPAVLAFGTSRIVRHAFLAVLLYIAATAAISLQWPGSLHPNNRMADWQAFQIAGELTLEGRAADNYDWTLLQHEQHVRTGQNAFMPWAYPPQFTLLTAPLGLLPVGLSYLLVQLALLGWFLRVVGRAAGAHVSAALTVALPALVTNLACGQNGFLTGALIGSFLLGLRDPARAASARPGWPLGAMVMKPHLAVAITLLALLERRWRAIALAAAITLASSAAATIVLGPAIWTTFLGATHQATQFLWAGDYPIERMTSVFACLSSLGLSSLGLGPGLAMAAHALIALAALGAVGLAWRRGIERDWLLALAGAASLMISPYNYDYDMPVIAVLAALVWPGLIARASAAEIAGLTVLAWLASGNGLWALAETYLNHGKAGATHAVSLSAPLLIVLFTATARVLRRPVAASFTAPPPRETAHS